MSEPRRFSAAQRAAIFLAADGKSEKSGLPLEEGWHADHRVPFVSGGATDVVNAQALTPRENMSKGRKMPIELRGWQSEFVGQFWQSTDVDFMLAALPGGGKTLAALHCAKSFLGGASRRLIVVVPTSNLRSQWRGEAQEHYGITLQTKEFRGTLKDGFDGLVTTYHSIASQPHLFRRLCAMHECMVVFDEIHHAGDQSSWGIAIQEAFELAKRRLCLSGTPFKHNGQKIPFLTVQPDGLYKIDFGYDYPRALRDGVVREVSFHRYSGSVTLAIGEEVCEFHTDDDLADDEAAQRLRGLLRSDTYTHGLLREAHERLLAVRKAKPDAGALALCIDANHAVKVAKILSEITGEEPDIIVSDDEMATGSVDGFRKSARKWIVAVRMVSEGVDIKRLMVMAYLTNWSTELFFRQAVGRIVRHQGTDFDTEAYCFMPDVEPLTTHAAAIERFQQIVLAEDERAERTSSERSEAAERLLVDVLSSSDAKFAGLTTRGDHKDTVPSLEIISLSEQFDVPHGKMAAIIEHFAGRANVGAALPPEPQEHLEDKLARLRRQCSKLAYKLSVALECEVSEIHAQYKRIANVGQDQMTVTQLEAKQLWLLKRLKDQTTQR